MSRLCCTGACSRDKDLYVDIEKPLVDYAWFQGFNPSCVCLSSLFRNKRYLLEVNWSYLDIKHEVTKFDFRHRDDCGTGGIGKVTAGCSYTHSAGPREPDLCLFRTKFCNSSDTRQNFTFKTEQKTTSRCEINIQRGYRIGSKLDLRLNLFVDSTSVQFRLGKNLLSKSVVADVYRLSLVT
jgi:hypothetical protein